MIPVGGVCCPSGEVVVNGVCRSQGGGQIPVTPVTPAEPEVTPDNFAVYYRN